MIVPPQRREKHNAYDVDLARDFTIEAWLGPTFFERATDAEYELLGQLAQFDFLELLAIPEDDSVARRLVAAGITVGVVREKEDHVGLHSASSAQFLGTGHSFRALLQDSGGSTKLAIERLCARCDRGSDFLVGSAEAVASAPVAADSRRYVTLSTLLGHLRLLCVLHGRFEVRPRFRVNEGFYYLYRRDFLFPEFREAWFLSGHFAENRLSGLWRRLEFVCRTYDQGKIESLRTPNNDVDDRCLFYLAFQYVLATGIFDDLAALADGLYDLRLPRKLVTLQARQDGSSRFRAAVSTHNSALSEFLDEASIRALIRSFYPIRDRLQHREFPYTVARLKDRRKRLPSGLVAPSGAVTDLAAGLGIHPPPAGSWVNADETLIELGWLCDASTEALRRVVNGYLPLIPWQELGHTRGRADSSADEHWKRFNQGIGVYLGWGTEPLLFDK
jgi:hypothetical protein